MTGVYVALAILGTSILSLLAGYFWARHSTSSKFKSVAGIAASAEQRLNEELLAEKAAKVATEDSLRKLADEHRAIVGWYNATKQSINRKARDEFEKLSGDPVALDAKLDQLLAAADRARGAPDS